MSPNDAHHELQLISPLPHSPCSRVITPLPESPINDHQRDSPPTQLPSQPQPRLLEFADSAPTGLYMPTPSIQGSICLEVSNYNINLSDYSPTCNFNKFHVSERSGFSLPHCTGHNFHAASPPQKQYKSASNSGYLCTDHDLTSSPQKLCKSASNAKDLCTDHDLHATPQPKSALNAGYPCTDHDLHATPQPKSASNAGYPCTDHDLHATPQPKSASNAGDLCTDHDLHAAPQPKSASNAEDLCTDHDLTSPPQKLCKSASNAEDLCTDHDLHATPQPKSALNAGYPCTDHDLTSPPQKLCKSASNAEDLCTDNDIHATPQPKSASNAEDLCTDRDLHVTPQPKSASNAEDLCTDHDLTSPPPQKLCKSALNAEDLCTDYDIHATKSASSNAGDLCTDHSLHATPQPKSASNAEDLCTDHDLTSLPPQKLRKSALNAEDLCTDHDLTFPPPQKLCKSALSGVRKPSPSCIKSKVFTRKRKKAPSHSYHSLDSPEKSEENEVSFDSLLKNTKERIMVAKPDQKTENRSGTKISKSELVIARSKEDEMCNSDTAASALSVSEVGSNKKHSIKTGAEQKNVYFLRNRGRRSLYTSHQPCKESLKQSSQLVEDAHAQSVKLSCRDNGSLPLRKKVKIDRTPIQNHNGKECSARTNEEVDSPIMRGETLESIGEMQDSGTSLMIGMADRQSMDHPVDCGIKIDESGIGYGGKPAVTQQTNHHMHMSSCDHVMLNSDHMKSGMSKIPTKPTSFDQLIQSSILPPTSHHTPSSPSPPSLGLPVAQQQLSAAMKCPLPLPLWLVTSMSIVQSMHEHCAASGCHLGKKKKGNMKTPIFRQSSQLPLNCEYVEYTLLTHCFPWENWVEGCYYTTSIIKNDINSYSLDHKILAPLYHSL